MGHVEDVAIVGAGAVGLATARELALAGRAPLVLEREQLGHHRGSSHGHSRIVRLAHDREEDVREAQEALALWRELERTSGRRLLTTVGGLDFGARLDATRDALTAAGVPYELVGPDEIERRFPGVAAHGQPAVFQRDTAVAHADAYLDLLAADAVAHGARLRTGAAVCAVEPEADHVDVVLDDGTRIRARTVVLAAGGWIAALAAQAGVPLPAAPTLQSPAHFRIAAPGPLPTVIDLRSDGRDFYSLPEAGGTVVKGGTHNPGAPVDLDGGREPDPAAVAEFAAWATYRYRGLEPEPYETYGCIYTWLPDARFHLARHGRVVVASCCSGRGFKFVPLTGRRAATLAGEMLDDDAVASAPARPQER